MGAATPTAPTLTRALILVATFSKLHNLNDPLISQQNKTPHEKLRGKEGGGIEIRKTFVVLQLSLRNNCGGEKIIYQVEPSQFGKMISMVIS